MLEDRACSCTRSTTAHAHPDLLGVNIRVFTFQTKSPDSDETLVKLQDDNTLLNTKVKEVSLTIIEPPHDKTNKMTCAPAKTQISLGIRVFAVRL